MLSSAAKAKKNPPRAPKPKGPAKRAAKPKQPAATTVAARKKNDALINQMNLSSGASDRVPPAPLNFPAPSNSLTEITYVPNWENIGLFADALTMAAMSKSNVSTQFDPQVYVNYRTKVGRLLYEGMNGNPVPSVSPIGYDVAAAFHMFNSTKEYPLPNGTRMKFLTSAGANNLPPSTVSFGAPDMSVDANGFKVLPVNTPGTDEEINESYRQVLRSTGVRTWSVGDKPPKISNGVSQFVNLSKPANAPTYNNEGQNANTFVPCSFPMLAGLGLVQLLSSSIAGEYNLPLSGSPAVYAGYYATYYLQNPRDRVTVAPISVSGLVAMVIGHMSGINSQAVKAGRPTIFTLEVPEFLVALVLNCIASSQQQNFPITMNISTPNGKAVRAGTQFPPRDMSGVSSNLYYFLVVELLRRFTTVTVKIPDEAHGGSSARLVIVPCFIVEDDIFEVARGALQYAGIPFANAPNPIEPTAWTDISTGLALTYATPNSLNGSPWENYVSAFREEGNEIAQYSPQYNTAQQKEYLGMSLTHYFRVFLNDVQARGVLDQAILSAAGPKQKRLIAVREMVSSPPAKKSGFAAAPPPHATVTYGLFTPGSLNYMAFPLPFKKISLDSTGDVLSSTTAQVKGWRQITAVNTPLGYSLLKTHFDLGRTSVFSGTKGEAPTELVRTLMNDAEQGLGGALADDIDDLGRLAREIYRAAAKKPNMKGYDSIARPATKVVKNFTRPLAQSYEYFMG